MRGMLSCARHPLTRMRRVITVMLALTMGVVGGIVAAHPAHAASAEAEFAPQANAPLTVSSAQPAFTGRFRKVSLAPSLSDPMELAVAPHGRVYFVERAGRVLVYDPRDDR